MFDTVDKVLPFIKSVIKTQLGCSTSILSRSDDQSLCGIDGEDVVSTEIFDEVFENYVFIESEATKACAFKNETKCET